MKVGLAELVIVALMGGAIAIVIDRGRPHEEETETPAQPAPRIPEVVPQPEPVPAPEDPAPEVPEVAPQLEPAIPAPTRADSLDSDAVKRGVADVQDQIDRCGPKYPDACGIVRLRVRVAPDGSVTSVDIVQTDSNRLGKCAAAVMKTATFDATERGSLFTYPFNFGCP